MKKCTKCGIEKPRSEFRPRPERGPNAVRSKCRDCSNAERASMRATAKPDERERALALARAWKRENRERVIAGKRNWESRNPERHAQGNRARCTRWRAKNVELARMRVLRSRRKKLVYYREYQREYQKSNRAACNAKYKAYMARKLKAMPVWADLEKIEALYELAQQLTKSTGQPWHVDHIVPLTSKFVCGLHTHDNLQVIPGTLNLSKSNRYWPDMPVSEDALTP